MTQNTRIYTNISESGDTSIQNTRLEMIGVNTYKLYAVHDIKLKSFSNPAIVHII